MHDPTTGAGEDSQPNTAPNGVTAVSPATLASSSSSFTPRPPPPRTPTWERARRFMVAHRRPRLSLQNKVLAGMTSTLLLLVMAAVAVFFAQKEEATRDRSRQSVDLLVELGRLQNALTDAETGQRGYLLTDDVRYLEPWRGAAHEVRRSIEVLHAIAAADKDADRERDLLVLENAADTKLAELQTVIDVQTERGRDAALQLVMADGSRATMQEARSALARLESRTLELRAERLQENAAARDLVVIVVLVGCGLSALLNVLIQISIKRDLVERDRDAWVMAAQRERIDESEEALDRQVRLLADANTALNAAKSRAEDLVHDLRQSNRDLTQFAYVASHDLKAPLRGIASLATWIEEDSASLSPRSRDHLQMLRQRIRRMEAMIDGVLQYSHAGRDEEGVPVASVHDFVEDLVELAEPPPGVVIDVDGGDFDAVVPPVMLQQVVLNLVGNAIKHGTPKGGVVRVIVEGGDDAEDSVAILSDRAAGTPHERASDRGGGHGTHTSVRAGWFRVRVVDEGPGIDPRYHGRIFGLFQTLQPKDRVEGAGIGLAVVKKLVELQGGVVQVNSAEGEGTEVSFTWPRTPKKHGAHPPLPVLPGHQPISPSPAGVA